ncbi:MAG: alpha/beta hydrolase [Clostridia bacterium]|nr:alpha/beta hydrolase [Clostridia bacterium]
MLKKTKLWDNGTPYYDPAKGQDEPSLVHYTDLGGNARPDREKTGCVIVFPGGGYGSLTDYEGEPISRMFNSFGIRSFVLNYRITPYHYPAILMDAQRAVRWVRYHADELMIDPDKIAVLGFSAGGHLASCASTVYDGGLSDGDEIDRVSCRPDAGILCYAVISMFEPWTHDGTRDVMMGDRPDREELTRRLTGYLNVTEDTPPIFMFHTTEDSAVPQENSLLMAQALAEKKIPYELHMFMDGDHGLGLALGRPGLEKWGELASIWLKKLGF